MKVIIFVSNSLERTLTMNHLQLIRFLRINIFIDSKY